MTDGCCTNFLWLKVPDLIDLDEERGSRRVVFPDAHSHETNFRHFVYDDGAIPFVLNI